MRTRHLVLGAVLTACASGAAQPTRTRLSMRDLHGEDPASAFARPAGHGHRPTMSDQVAFLRTLLEQPDIVGDRHRELELRLAERLIELGRARLGWWAPGEPPPSADRIARAEDELAEGVERLAHLLRQPWRPDRHAEARSRLDALAASRLDQLSPRLDAIVGVAIHVRDAR